MRFHDLSAFRPGPVTFWTTFLYLVITLPVIYVQEIVPPAPKDLPGGLNLTEAWQDLQNITSAYHPFNSRENDRVRQFFINRSKEVLNRNGIDYTVESRATASQSLFECNPDSDTEENLSCATRAPGVTVFDDQAANFTMIYDAGTYLSGNSKGSTWTGQYFEGNNYYIYIHGKADPKGDWWLSKAPYAGSNATGGVLVNCHFDSVATSYGATDDGVACVTMLQLLSYFTSAGHQPDNGIVLLFNNAEEDGLLGSRAFGSSPLVQFCRTFVNLEGVGAGGRAMLFRTTDLEVAMAYSGTPHPFGSIIANDGFDRGAVMSGTDYEIFADIYGLRGLDIAFYEPRSRYHTTEDDARHTSINSIWHMLSATLATTKKLSQNTSIILFSGREDNKKPDRGVWFDWLGSAWIAFPLRGLFAWSLTLLIATPLAVVLIVYVLFRRDKCYFLARDGVWGDFFRFPLAFAFAAALTMVPLFALAKFNPLIIYSSGYAVWAMALSSCHFGFWLIMEGSSNLTRLSVNFWLFALSWVFQVFAATAEDQLHVGSFYFAAFFHSAIFLSLALSLLEQLALPRRQISIQEPYDANQAGESAYNNTRRDEEDEQSNTDDEASDGASASARMPLLGTNGSRGESNNQSSFASACRRSIYAALSSARTTVHSFQRPYEHEELWSSQLPVWTWFLQLLVLAPVHLILVGSQGLAAVSAIAMTGTDGSRLLTPVMVLGILSIVLLLPLTPFIHRTTHHIPMLLFVIFIGTFIYNFAAFPFSTNNRFKFIFQQTIDLDKGTNIVTLSGIEEYLRHIIDSLPEAAGQSIKCQPSVERDFMDCQYDASPYLPDLANGADLEDSITVITSKSADGTTAHIQLDALETRTCYLDFSRPISNFTVEGEAKRDPRLSQNPPDGRIQHIQVWRRRWEGTWNLNLQLTEDRRSIMNDNPGAGYSSDLMGNEELKLRSETSGLQPTVDLQGQPMEATVRCAWSDANNPKTIPALHRLQQYMPSWAIVTKRGFSLVEVKKKYKVVSWRGF
ncbi:Vacuolar membrane protease [Tolypocladium ophioglossoides CBS 100239]|uniref:Peptide hydrolase n=1 Tax=Tolypocladium ophioglossoides (strain CBS 100239) TaxID=1163406 RepID=A0A0L0NE39_TOLOC|nr:Vacuolar membrane protease [Tolypocladium ophioglossoides CBS 100239]